jgi:histone H3/H4
MPELKNLQDVISSLDKANRQSFPSIEWEGRVVELTISLGDEIRKYLQTESARIADKEGRKLVETEDVLNAYKKFLSEYN